MFSGIAHRQEQGSFVCNEQKKRKRKYTSLFIKYLQTTFLKATTQLQFDAVPWQSKAIAKQSHFKVKPLQNDVIIYFLNSLAMNTIITVFSICNDNIALGHCTGLARSVGVYTSNNISQSRSNKQLLSYYYET